MASLYQKIWRCNFAVVLLGLFISLGYCENLPCNQSGPSGCLSCTEPTYLIIYNKDTLLYTCSNRGNCNIVNNASECMQCEDSYFLVNSVCEFKSIRNCQNYSVINNQLVCTCELPFMTQVNNTCWVNSTYCETYDQTTNKCLACPLNKTLNTATSQYCVQQIPNCLIISYNGCIQCQEQYIIDTTNNHVCKLFSPVAYQFTSTIATCLQLNFYYDSTLNNCVQTTTLGLNYCKQINPINTTNCQLCIEGYFLTNSGECKSCKNSISNCLLCSPCTSPTTCTATCTACRPSYFLFTDPISQGQTCRSCSTYGCKNCERSSISQGSIRCTQCELGSSLFNGTCYSCPVNYELNISTLQCDSCPQNCKYCQNGLCIWCSQEYAINPDEKNKSLGCMLASQFRSVLAVGSAYQILSKELPLQQELIYNNPISLMSSCQQQKAFKYSCLCNESFHAVTSLCYNITGILTGLDLTLVFGGQITTDEFLAYPDTVRLMAQLPTFDSIGLSIESVTDSEYYFTESKIAGMLQIYAQIIRRQSAPLTTASASTKSSQQRQSLSSSIQQSPQSLSSQTIHRLLLNTNSTLTQLFSLVSSSWSQTFSLTETTIIYGNGYYMKYYPKGNNITDTDDTFITVSGKNSTDFLFLIVFFDGQTESLSLTGNVFAYSNLASYQVGVTIEQIQFAPTSAVSYAVYKNNIQDTNIQARPQESSMLQFSLYTSTQSFPLGYNIKYVSSQTTDINSLYSSERIEMIFYQPAFIYVLIFLLAYLFLIPCCSLVDFMDGSKGQRRKRVRSEELTVSDEGKQNKRDNHEQQSSQNTIQITINYKDFFPMYNICNTPRPRRILKLCLFLLNTQHSITFLTLIYFNLNAGYPVVAVVLGVPAYFCTIIMGYICGCFTLLRVPMWVKYSINLIAIGYWILWISLMPRFRSQQYQPYVYIFAIVFFAIDMIIDLLQMFMVYFTIKQSDRQMKMFSCLAAWLSKRGYYEYDRLARELND